MLNLPLFTVGCLNKRVQKLESSIMTHNPEVFEMEQQDLLWKRIGDVLWAHCLYLDVIWTEIYIYKKKSLFICSFPFVHGWRLQGLGKGSYSDTLHCWRYLEKRKSRLLFQYLKLVEHYSTSIIVKVFIMLLAIYPFFLSSLFSVQTRF